MKVSLILKNKYLLFLAILIVKLSILFFLISSYGKSAGGTDKIISGFVFKSNDYTYFLQPVDNYFETGNFTYGFGKPYAGRMPAYWIVYWGLRYVFSQNTSLLVMILFQVILSVLASLYLAKTALLLTEKVKAYWITLFLSTVSLYTISYDIQTQTESLAISAMAFFIYHYLCYYKKIGNTNKHLLLAGFFLGWAIFLRLYLGILLPIVCVLIILVIRKEHSALNIKKIIFHCFIFVFPFVFFDSVWIIRNYNVLGKFIPLESALHESYGKLYPRPWTKIRSLIVTMGHNPAYFEANTLGKWFKDEKDTLPFAFNNDQFNQLAFNADSINELKRNFNLYIKETDSLKEKVLEERIIHAADNYLADYKSSRKFQVNVTNPIARFKKFIFASGSGYLLLAPFDKMNVFEKFIKYATSAYYYIILIFGLVFVFYRKLWRSVKAVRQLVTLGTLAIISNILVIVYISDIQENRYFMPIFPFLILFVSILLATFSIKTPSKQKN